MILLSAAIELIIFDFVEQVFKRHLRFYARAVWGLGISLSIIELFEHILSMGL